MPQLTPALVDVLLSDSVAVEDPAETVNWFGVSLRPASDAVAVSEEATA